MVQPEDRVDTMVNDLAIYALTQALPLQSLAGIRYHFLQTSKYIIKYRQNSRENFVFCEGTKLSDFDLPEKDKIKTNFTHI